jgi:hypothetical protein
MYYNPYKEDAIALIFGGVFLWQNIIVLSAERRLACSLLISLQTKPISAARYVQRNA